MTKSLAAIGIPNLAVAVIKSLAIPFTSAAVGGVRCVFSKNERLRILAGRQHMTLKPTDYAPYIGSRAQRGRMLPRGYKSPDAIIVEESKNLKT